MHRARTVLLLLALALSSVLAVASPASAHGTVANCAGEYTIDNSQLRVLVTTCVQGGTGHGHSYTSWSCQHPGGGNWDNCRFEVRHQKLVRSGTTTVTDDYKYSGSATLQSWTSVGATYTSGTFCNYAWETLGQTIYVRQVNTGQLHQGNNTESLLLIPSFC